MTEEAALEKILEAARGLIAEEGYSALTMTALARAAGLALADLYRHVPDRVALLAAFVRRTDLAVLAQVPSFGAEESARDRIFDLLMARFEAAAPDKAMIRVLRQDLRRHPAEALRLAPIFLNAMRWLAEAAGIPCGGVAGAARSRALLGVYLSVLPVWLGEEDPGLAKTMAALDRRLRRAEELWPAIWGARGGPRKAQAGEARA